ncbi:transmembrane protein adipocyte-associated 1-like isoform X1 [Dendronephthya gigantea]|uniref:transmembrane protein adipocyte-associated 1-like isoform X1 n=1 Tax=Dendronephthya gigantea TaxID=151771 RepID=UPI001069243F|nr:transmembrane protein adipocyte-associated 1-like isoform X1 [Dendronephthya gigantea]XP_028398059.1 transmembrane protein adipocyte-associated 1-like isoform X1 [Dendronephthya gigantea]XP_028398060.1 transmembrane protein adipocyte-associated 1-like isoform X1 [Dendronephthya gigantea]
MNKMDSYFSIPKSMVTTRNASSLGEPIDYGVCREMLRKSIGNTCITYWNLALLTPNMLFLIFLAYHIGLFYKAFQQRSFPVVKTLLILVSLVCCVSIIRGFVATITKAHRPDGNLANESLWLFLRFLVLAVEISVIGFGLFGSGRNKGVGKRVISLSFFLALVYATIQSLLEVYAPNRAKIFKNKYDMFHHGGMLFWFITSCIFFVIYSSIVILPQTNCLCGRGFLSLPSNRAFYRYAAVLCVVNLSEAVGSILVYYRKTYGLCVLNVAVLLFYSLFAQFIYFTFLHKSFRLLKKANLHIQAGIANYTVASSEASSSSAENDNSSLVI